MMINGLRLSDAEAFLKLDELARTLETELAAALAEKQDFLDTLTAIYDKLGIKEGDAPGGEKVSVTVLRHVTAALAQRDEANRLLREAAESTQYVWEGFRAGKEAGCR